MKYIKRDADALAALRGEERAIAAVAYAAGAGVGALYAPCSDGMLYKRSETVSLYDGTEADPLPDKLPYDPADSRQFGIIERDHSLSRVFVVARGANRLEVEALDPDKQIIAAMVAEMAGPLVKCRSPRLTDAQMNGWLVRLGAEADRIFQRYMPEAHPETLHAGAVSDLVARTLKAAGADKATQDIYTAGYRIHDIGKLCSLPPGLLTLQANQALGEKDKAYFDKRNRDHPFGLMLMLPFLPRELVEGIALHHLSLSSDSGDKAGLPKSGLPAMARYGRVADVFAAMTDHARYPGSDLRAVPAEDALQTLFERAKRANSDIPMLELGHMAFAHVFSHHAQARQGKPLEQGGIVADAAKLKEVEASIVRHLEWMGHAPEDLPREMREAVKPCKATAMAYV